MQTLNTRARAVAATLLMSPATRGACLALAVFMSLMLFGLGATPMAVNVATPPWDKVLHFSTYAVLGSLIALGFRGRAPWLAALITVGLGCVDESLQLFEPGRHADLTDLAADAAAAVFSAWACHQLMLLATEKARD